jgi:hypothetical protein
MVEGYKQIHASSSKAGKNWDRVQAQQAAQSEARSIAEGIKAKRIDPTLTNIPAKTKSQVESILSNEGFDLAAAQRKWLQEKSGERAEATAAGRSKVKQEELIEKIPPALRNQVRDFYPGMDVAELRGINTDNARHLQSAVDSAANLEEIANYTVQHPGALGYIADLQRRLNVDAFRGMSLTPENKTKIDQATDAHIDLATGGRNIPDAASAKVLAKMLTTQAFNDAAMFGARGGTIYLDRAFREIYQQASSPDAFFNILSARYRNADLEMSNYHMGMNRRSDIDKHQFWNRGPDAYVRDFMQAKDQQRSGKTNFAPKGETFTDPETGKKWQSKGGPRRSQSTWEEMSQ